MAVNWRKIKNEYINTNTSQRKLAEKHGVSERQIAKRCKDESWVKLREEKRSKISAKVQQKAIEKIAEKESAELADFDSVLDSVYAIVINEAKSLANGQQRKVNKKKLKRITDDGSLQEIVESTNSDSTLDKAKKIVELIQDIAETKMMINPEGIESYEDDGLMDALNNTCTVQPDFNLLPEEVE